MKRILPCYFLLLLLYGAEVNSTEINAQQNQQKLPSILFLEYLAEMTEVDGQLIGPQDIAESQCEFAKLKRNKNDFWYRKP